MEVKVIEDNNCVSFVKNSLINDFMININDKQINGICYNLFIIYLLIVNEFVYIQSINQF